MIVEDTSSKAMVAIDGAGFDWRYMADDEVSTNMALMTFSESEFSKSEFDLATYKRDSFSSLSETESLIIKASRAFLISFEVSIQKLLLSLGFATFTRGLEAAVLIGLTPLTGDAALKELCLVVLIGTMPDLVKTAIGAKFLQELENFDD
nr:hypothetical protein [Tanacetum cinerariifolium]